MALVSLESADELAQHPRIDAEEADADGPHARKDALAEELEPVRLAEPEGLSSGGEDERSDEGSARERTGSVRGLTWARTQADVRATDFGRERCMRGRTSGRSDRYQMKY